MNTIPVTSLSNDSIDGNWFPVEFDSPDPSLAINSKIYKGSEGLSFRIYEPLINAEDVQINNYSFFILSDRLKSEDTFQYTTPTTTGTQFISYIAGNHYTDTNPPAGCNLWKFSFYPGEANQTEKYKLHNVTIGFPEKSDKDRSGERINLPSYEYTTKDYFFHFDIIDENHVNIKHDDGVDEFMLYFVWRTTTDPRDGILATNTAPEGQPQGLEFAPVNAPSRHLESIYGQNITYKSNFNYVIDDNTQSMLLMLQAANNNYMIRYSPSNSKVIAVDFKNIKNIGPVNVLKLKYDKSIKVKSDSNILNSPLMKGLSTDWYSYQPTIETDHVNTLACNCFTELRNNYLLNSEFYNSNIIDGVVRSPLNITPLKNQLTPAGTQIRSTIIDSKQPVNIRRYSKIHSGTNQQLGSDKIYLSYDTNITTLDISPGKLTYFHTPQNMYPYKFINVNDLSLSDKGSTGGDSPLTSDKMFKKKAGYPFVTNHGDSTDEQSYTWLCTWLYTNPETGISTWLDRYYKPDSYSYYSALRIPINPSVIYNNHYSSILKHLNPTVGLFDKISDLRLQPGSWYAYYKLGKKDFNNVVNSIPGIQVNQMEEYRNVDNSSNINIINDTYVLDGSHRGKINISANKDNDIKFSISFTMDSDNWKLPFGPQIVGDYSSSGFGVFDSLDASLINIIHQPQNSTEDIISVANYNLDPITSFNVEKTSNDDLVWVVNESSFDAIYVILINHEVRYKGRVSEESYEVREYDLNGSLKRSKILDLSAEAYIKQNDKKRETDTTIPDRSQKLYSTTPYVIHEDDIIIPFNYKDNMALMVSMTDLNGSLQQIPDLPGHSSFRSNVFDDDKATDTIVLTSAGPRYITTHNTDSAYYNYNQIHACNNKNTLYLCRCDDIKSTLTVYKEFNPVTTYKLPTNTHIRYRLLDYTRIDGADVFLLTGQQTQYLGRRTTTKHHQFICKGNPDSDQIDIQQIENLNNSTPGRLQILKSTQGEYELVFTHTLKSVKYDMSLNVVKDYTESFKNNYYKSNAIIGTQHPYRYNDFNNTKPLLAREKGLYFKTRLVNSKNINNVKTDTLYVNTTTFKPGPKHFVYTCDTVNGATTIYVNGRMLAQNRMVPNLYRSGTKSEKSLLVGDVAYINNTLLSDFTGEATTLATNCTITNLRTYNTSLNYYQSKSTYRQTVPDQIMTIDIPTGYRNYIDGVDLMFKHRLPGRKSEQFDINFYTLTVSDVDLIKDITTRVDQSIRSMIPLNTSPRDYTWSKDQPTDLITPPSLEINKYRIYQECVAEPSPTPTPTQSPSPTPTPTITPTTTTTPSITISPTVTPSISISPSLTPTTTPTSTVTPTPTPSISISATPTPTVTPTVTPSASITSSVSVTPTPTTTPDASLTPTPTVTPTITPSTSAPLKSACCDDFNETVTTTGDLAGSPQNKGLAAFLFESGGTLCYDALQEGGQPGRQNLKTDDDLHSGFVNTTGNWVNPEIVYVTADGQKCYRGNVTVKDSTGVWTILTQV